MPDTAVISKTLPSRTPRIATLAFSWIGGLTVGGTVTIAMPGG